MNLTESVCLKERAAYRGQLLLNEPLSHYTTWRVGGPAKALYKPADLADLVLFLQSLPLNEPILWLGLGSNTLICDEGFKGTVILMQNALNELQILDNNQLHVQAGVSCAKMARFCARHHLAGGEFWAGIPGTMGGALRMNAGCHQGETWNYVKEVDVISRQGQIYRRRPDEFVVSYRQVEGLLPDEAFVAATFQLEPGDKDSSLDKIKSLLARRTATQPTNEYNCGSVFRNPPHQFAAKLIESSGLKGYRLGGAMVSEKHANFIINYQGHASAKDIESLIRLVQEKVLQDSGVQLIREVHFIGEISCPD